MATSARIVLVVLFAMTTVATGARRASAQELPFTHYTTDSERTPLPSAAVNKIYQDRLGYIWMAVFSSGVVRYDGTTMETYSVDEGLRDPEVWGMAEDRSGRLWVASENGLSVSEEPLAHYEPGRSVRFTTQLGGVPLLDRRVWTNNLAVGTDGAVWVGTAGDGIVRYRIGSDESLSADTLRLARSGSGDNASVLAIAALRDGSVWISLESGGILKWSPTSGSLAPAFAPELLEGESTSVLYESISGILWAGTRSGKVIRISDGRIAAIGPQLESGVVGMAESRDGTLWAASEGGGVLRGDISRGAFRIIGRPNGLLSNHVHHVMEDAEGNVWFAQSGGVSKLRPDYSAFQNYSARTYAGERPVIPGAGVGSLLSAVGADDPCRIWAGTSEGGAACIRSDGSSLVLQEADGLRSNWVNALHRDTRGRLWLGTIRGINGISFGSAQLPVFGEQRTIDVSGRRAGLRGYTSLTILSIGSGVIQDDGGTAEIVWFPGIRHLIALVDDDWFVFSLPSGLPPSILNTAAMDKSGHLWVGTRDRGLYRTTERLTVARLHEWQSESIGAGGVQFGRQIMEPMFEQVWSLEDGAPSNNIGPLLWIDDTLWIGTPRGLAILDGASIRMVELLTHVHGLGADNVTSMAFSDASGTVWVGTNRGLAEIDPQSHRVLRTVTQEDGLVDNEVWLYGSVHAGGDGSIYYGTAKGVAVYHPANDRPNEVVPPVRLRHVDLISSANGRSDISFEYAGLSFANEKSVRYRTRLVGYDRGWSEEKSDVKLRYTRLPAFFTPRRYTLEVAARNNDGVWASEPLSYSFSIAPPWWLRWWAFLGYLALFSAALLGFLALNRRLVVRKEQAKMRTREVELRAEAAHARSEAAEARARALAADNERKALELEKAKELEQAYGELHTAHVHLKQTQAQLVQQEKLASLGQLTAGIAHEIKNPLNFINNFALLAQELAAELSQALADKEEPDAIEEIIQDLRVNTQKIGEHGKRADGIVQAMMHHARGTDGKRERVVISRLVEEYVSISYHGMKATVPDFSVEITRAYDDGQTELEVMAQDIGRVLINLITNALHAVEERAARNGTLYEPRIGVKTARIDGYVEIRISDNGTGIPESVRERIFEPFFTTKPAGSGTGLGLSLAYDIVTQGHGGSLEVSGAEGEGATFIIRLPLPDGYPPPSLSRQES